VGVALIVVLSLTRMPDIGAHVPEGDKIGHVLAYACVMGWYALLCATRGALLWRAAALLALGVALEFAQARTGYRSFDVRDMLADALGIAMGMVLWLTPWRDALARVERWLATR
jgi:VanZ family protein